MRNMLLDDWQDQEVVTMKNSYYKLNDNKIIPHQICGMQLKHCISGKTEL